MVLKIVWLLQNNFFFLFSISPLCFSLSFSQNSNNSMIFDSSFPFVFHCTMGPLSKFNFESRWNITLNVCIVLLYDMLLKFKCQGIISSRRNLLKTGINS